MNDSSPESVASVLKVFGILEVLAESKEIAISELSNKVMMPKSTAYRFLQTMKSLGYVNQENDSDKYSLNLKLLDLGNRVLDHQNFLAIADSEMRKLRDKTKETIHLAVREGEQIIYINKVASEQYSLCLTSKIGNQANVYASGLGKILLAWLDDESKNEIIDHLNFIQFTPKTIMSKEAFLAELDKVKQCGYGKDDEESELGLRCFSVPIYNRLGNIIAALSLSTSIFRCNTAEDEQKLIDELNKTAAKISELIGFNK
ncbi:DNA-binding transcriptional regulator KdgR [Orbus sturtevantii]|uniref:DNA-binding transcriptional regulator KdgR n=1 Tax=Orbus sturtevantii TaxID=3074109 RepID=UPI00370D559B